MNAASAFAPIVVHDADQAAKLAAIARSGACETGGVLALDFIAVRTAMGDRWPLRQEDVHARIEREILRVASRTAICLRLTESEYLVSFTEVRGSAAQAQAFNIMERLLTHFLGRCDPGDLIVKSVSALTEDGIETRPLSRSDVEGARAFEKAAVVPAASPAPASTLIEGPAERVVARLGPQDVVHIPSGLNIGTRMSISLHRLGMERQMSFREEHALSTNSLLQSNLLAIDALRDVMRQARRPAIFILPLFLQTMASSRARSIVLDELQRFSPLDQRRLIIEISGIERGTPSSRLIDIGWQLRPFCRAVSGRAQLERSALAALAGARLSGIHLSARDLGFSAAQKAAGLLAAGQSARTLAPMIMAVDLPDRDALYICEAAGFTHAAVPAADA